MRTSFTKLMVALLIVIYITVVGGEVIDLTHIYDEKALYPPVGADGTPKGLFNFTIMHRGYEPSLDNWLEINWFGMFEHGSTHMDAPAHYAEGRAHLHEVPVSQLIGPAVMIDMVAQGQIDPDYLMTIDNIKNWETKHGVIPKNGIVIMNTGKHKLYPNRKLFYGTDTPDNTSTYHNPGIEPTAARWLMHERQIKAFGTDSHSCDPGQNNNRNPCHSEFLPNGVILLEFVANLDRMPATGSQVFVGPLKLRDASGGPCRIIAITGEELSQTSFGRVTKYSLSLILAFLFIAHIFSV